MSFWTGIAQLRTILATETDYNSPNSEELMEQLRENIEALFMLLLDTGDSGSATSDPADNTDGYLYDTGAAYDTDEHNGRTLLITSGLAIGNLYTIDDTGATTLVCTGDNLYAGGVRSGDTYKILYDLKVNTDGHDHNGANSKKIVASIDQAAMADDAVGQAELKTNDGTVSNNTSAWTTNTLPGGQYGFYPRIYMSSSTSQIWGATIAYQAGGAFAGWTSALTVIQLLGVSPYNITAYQRYVRASGEVHWVFILRDKMTTAIKRMWQSPDHPCFGNGNKPKLCPHPFPDFDPIIDEIVVINPTKEEVLEMKRATIVEADDQPNRGLLRVIAEDYEIDEESNPDWPDVPVTVGLPEDWNEAWLERRRVTPVKMIIPKPKEVLIKSLKKKAVVEEL